MAEHIPRHGESQISADAAGDAIDEYYNRADRSPELNDAISGDRGYSSLRWIIAKAVDNAARASLPANKLDQLVRGYDGIIAAFSALSLKDQYGRAHEPYVDAVFTFAHDVAELVRPATVNLANQTTVAELDDTDDAADWIAEGHTLDAHEVAYLRSLIVPAPAIK